MQLPTSFTLMPGESQGAGRGLFSLGQIGDIESDFRAGTRRTSLSDEEERKHGLDKRTISPPFGGQALPSEITVVGV